MTAVLALSRAGQVLRRSRRRAGALDARLPAGAPSLRGAAWAGLAGAACPRRRPVPPCPGRGHDGPTSWADPSLVQTWGTRFSVYVVPAEGPFAVFTLGRLPDDAAGPAARGADHGPASTSSSPAGRMDLPRGGWRPGRRPQHVEIRGADRHRAHQVGGRPAAICGAVPAARRRPVDARLELARRYLHVFGPGTAESFAEVGGGPAPGRCPGDVGRAGAGLTPVRKGPVGAGWILADDEPGVPLGTGRRGAGPPAAQRRRLLPAARGRS